MQQYWDIKNAHQDKILFFRMGDFFEMFHQDAELAAPILNIALTVRNKKAGDQTKMCGVPHHSIATPIAILLAAGHKVAICDQIEDPALAKGLVKRAVTRVLSPGMVYDPATLDQLEANYLCSFDDETLSFIEPTTGESFYYRTDAEGRARLLALLAPRELVLTSVQRSRWNGEGQHEHLHLTVHDSLIAADVTTVAWPESARRLMHYATAMQGPEIRQGIAPFCERRLLSRMELTPTVVRQLELLTTYKGERKGSLLFAVDRTKTSAGARLLKNWLQFPLLDVQEIDRRLDQVEFWTKQPGPLKELRQILSGMGDVERRLGKVANPGCQARDLVSLSASLRTGLLISPMCGPGSIDETLLATCQRVVADIERTIVEDPPLALRQMGVIRKGVSAALDELMVLTEHSQQMLEALEERERKSTGISSLKIRYNNVFGYYIEVTNTHTAKVPPNYQRKQTLANAERYTTEELSVLEGKILSAHAKRVELESEIFASLRRRVLDATIDLLGLAQQWSELDVIQGLAWLAIEYKYRRPRFSSAGGLQLEASRHPVIEQEVSGTFVPNGLNLRASECLLLTGPNMAGKSTFMRQVAVICLMAQMGSFVPAETAILPLLERIFTRIGASDYLSEGLSTFMVEMKEAAEIVAKANENSLVILDEVGRGTSTYDGMSLAQAILEFLVRERRSLTLFATHYHELTHMASHFPQIKNAHMSIREKGGDISFLHTVVAGPASKSYGVHVAKLAGLPTAVTQRARTLLGQLENRIPDSPDQMSLLTVETESASPELSPEIEQLLQQIRQTSVHKMTPLEALNQIEQWQRRLS